MYSGIFLSYHRPFHLLWISIGTVGIRVCTFTLLLFVLGTVLRCISQLVLVLLMSRVFTRTICDRSVHLGHVLIVVDLSKKFGKLAKLHCIQDYSVSSQFVNLQEMIYPNKDCSSNWEIVNQLFFCLAQCRKDKKRV